MTEKVVVAMSGGVDSSVAALLLQRQGYDVVGVTMKLYSLDHADLPDYYRGCCTVDDVEDARMVCHRLGVPHYVMNVQREFQEFVIDYFCSEYQQGRTPHPCIACNDKIKFNFLAHRARVLGADRVATGHYARIERAPLILSPSKDQGPSKDAGWSLRKGLDCAKDQSYVLYGMGQEELAHTLMPVGSYSKAEIRQFALDADFPNAQKLDSQDICFIPFGDYKAFLKERVAPQPGEIVDTQGNVLGTHDGIEMFTVGQRRGLGLSGGPPRYVVRLEPETSTVVVGAESDLYRDKFLVSRVNYVSGSSPESPVPVSVKIRYKFQEAAATLYPADETAVVRFDQPQRAVTPGQAAVFYQGDTVLGGGIISDDTNQ